MKIVILGAGPAGLYCGLLIKKANPTTEITILERNPLDVTYGWGVVFSDRTLASFQRADYRTYEQITNRFVLWDAIDVFYRATRIRCGGHIIASIARRDLLQILQQRCLELGISLRFEQEVHDLSELPDSDLLIGADGINSLLRRTHAQHFQPRIQQGNARYIWLGTPRVLDAFTFIFRENEHGLFQVHAYPSSGTGSTFIVECDEDSWRRAGLDKADEATSLAYCERLFAADLGGAPLLSNNSKWISFATLKTRSWSFQRSVLLGDAAHTAHFSIGSGTKLAMEDAIALATALEQHDDLAAALHAYEQERQPVVEIFQRAAHESQLYFETLKRYLELPPQQFAFQLLTRSGRVGYDDLHLRDARFGDAVDRAFQSEATPQRPAAPLAPPPLFASLRLRELDLSNRLVLPLPPPSKPAATGAGLLLTEIVAVSEEARITPEDLCLSNSEQAADWRARVVSLHARLPGTRLAIQLGHAGRRGAMQSRSLGLDRPLRTGSWPLLAPSPLAYAPHIPLPREMDLADMQHICSAFVAATSFALSADFDLLQLHMAHGYLLASFLSPLTNQRRDAYGGDLAGRLRFPLAIFDAVRAAWPAERPLAVALSATDGVKGSKYDIEEAISVARTLKEHGCDLLTVLAGQTTPASELTFGRGFLTFFSDRLRNEAGLPTLVAGYLTSSNEINTILAAGRADLCVFTPLDQERVD